MGGADESERVEAGEAGPLARIRAGLIGLAERGVWPDGVVRAGIRRLLQERLAELETDDPCATAARRDAFVAAAPDQPVATATREANEQHYEVPAAFFREVLGPRAKYSCCDYGPALERAGVGGPRAGRGAGGDPGFPTLEQAEVTMLEKTCTRARVEDGMRLLDLGCGWGSLSLFLAERYPSAEILSVSNSKGQREHILAVAAERGLANLRVVTADANVFEPGAGEAPFDRVLSIEMFEHMRSWPRLFERIARWLAPDGRLFLHYFCHRTTPYPYEVRNESDWMSRYFFTGGIMPCYDLAARFPEHLEVEESFVVDGRQYERTCNDWLEHLDARVPAVLPILASTYGEADALLWLQRWRLFFMACAELFGHRHGSEWFVAHHRLARTAR
ncbi:MAG: class I SAM-dependent methyltransferase [Spirochaetaceae bacterium]|nr:class I SAM-dependent methyltransferase [Myxococcales bacterium]MCB9726447.1 class I SAM-dependent methyltransferase [Spirochaetaceae bacterium]